MTRQVRGGVRGVVVTVLMVVLMCSAPPGSGPLVADAGRPGVVGQSLEARFAVAARQACDERAHAGVCQVIALGREEIAAGLAHYRLLLKVGQGAFDVIAVHRLVRERQPGVPVQTTAGYFYLHGSASRFDHVLVAKPNLLTYLAARDVDVWGLDLRWVQVPLEQPEFGFMKDWTFGTHIPDILLATRLARHLRRLTGQGFQPVVLAGQSLGASLVFAAANSDATLPPNDRDFSGLIPMDTIYALPPGAGATRTLFCQIEQSYRTALAAGSYSMNSIGGIQAGTYALADPYGHSLSATLTNREVALNQGAALTFLPALQFHTFSVWRDAGGRPIDGTFTRSAAMFLTMATFTPWRARATMIDYFAVPCATNDLPYDDHLSDITAPILYIGSAGGFGLEGLYILDLLGSDDTTSVFVQLRADDQAWDDFGHLDWMAADDAPALVWQPIADWITSRAQR